MSPKPTLILSLPEPCDEDWNQMTPNGCGRFCASCQKTVIDFTVMTDAEIIAIFRNSETPPCGRFFSEQLNRPLQEPENARIFSFYQKIAAAILVLQAFTIHSFAQGKKKPAVAAYEKKRKRQDPVRAIKGRLTGNREKPAPNVPLVLKAGGYDTLYATTDEQGCFQFILPDNYQPQNVQILLAHDYAKSSGYIVDETLELNEAALHTEIVLRQFEATLLPEAEIKTTSYTKPIYTGIAPVYREYRKPTAWQKITKPFRKHRG